jgi:CBS-domain-containing membrane protein
MQKVAEIMTRDVKTVTTSTSVRELAELFSSHRIGTVPVVDAAGNLLGVVTETDLVEQNRSLHIPTVISLFDWIIYLESDRKFMEELKKVSAQTVGDIYIKEVVTVTAETPINAVADLMTEKKIHTVPVVEGNKLIGVVSRIDLIRTMNR